MASLILAASFLTYNKIKDKREQRKEKKRQGFQKRYDELERERTREEEEYQARRNVVTEGKDEGSEATASGTDFHPLGSEDVEKSPHGHDEDDDGEGPHYRESMTRLSRRNSSQGPERRRSKMSSSDGGGGGSPRSADDDDDDDDDDPRSWVDGVLRDLSTSRQGGRGPPKDSIDLGGYDRAAKMRSLI